MPRSVLPRWPARSPLRPLVVQDHDALFLQRLFPPCLRLHLVQIALAPFGLATQPVFPSGERGFALMLVGLNTDRFLGIYLASHGTPYLGRRRGHAGGAVLSTTRVRRGGFCDPWTAFMAIQFQLFGRLNDA